jgi:hypothetical protein
MSCKINIGLVPSDCQDISVGGVTGRFWLIPQADYLAATITKGTDNEITAIVPVAPPSGFAFAYRFEVPPRSIVTGNAFASNAGISGLNHLFTALVADMSMAQKNSLAALFNTARALVIVETQAPKITVPADDESPPYLLYGERSALEMSATETNLGDQATGNGIMITLTTPTNSQLELNYPTNVIMTTAAVETLEAVTP